MNERQTGISASAEALCIAAITYTRNLDAVYRKEPGSPRAARRLLEQAVRDFYGSIGTTPTQRQVLKMVFAITGEIGSKKQAEFKELRA